MARSKTSYSFKGVGVSESKKIESDPASIRKTLTQLLGAQLPVAVIWIKDRSYVLKSKLSEKTNPQKNIVVALVPGQDSNEFKDVLEKTGSMECYITLYTKSASVVGIPTQFLEVNADGYFFKLPEKIVKIDRRKEPRFKIPRGYRVDVSFEIKAGVSENIQKRVFDISSSGLSFLVSKEELEQFPEGLEIDQFSFRLRNRLMMCDVVIRNRVRVDAHTEESEAYKVGITFKNLSEEHQDFIQNYIIENIIQYIQS